MDIVRSGSGKSLSLRVSGKLDAYWSDALSSELESCVRKGALDIELNLKNISFISSAGLRVLLIYIKQMRTINGRLRIVDPSEKVRDIFDLSGLTDLLLTDDQAGDSATGEAAMRPTPDGTGMYSRRAIGEDEAGDCTIVDAPGDGSRNYPQLQFPASRIGLGIGAFGDRESGVEKQFGEFLAAAGITVCVPTDGRGHPDYMIEDRVFVPTISVYSGLSAEAAWSEEVHFEVSEQHRGIPLSTLASIALEKCSSAVVLSIAEAAGLIGATLKRSPAGGGFHYGLPELREQFTYTTEPSFQQMMTVTAAVISRKPSAALRPLHRDAQLYGHAHTAVFSYRPIPAGKIDSAAFIRTLYDEEQVETVLHLMFDDRQTLSSVESEFIRGVLYIAPLKDFASPEDMS